MGSQQDLPPSLAPSWSPTNPRCWTISTKRHPKTGEVYQLVGSIGAAGTQVCFPSCKRQGSHVPSQQINSLWGYSGTVKQLVKGAAAKSWRKGLPPEITKLMVAKRLANAAWTPVLSIFIVENPKDPLPQKPAQGEVFVVFSRATGRLLPLSKEAKALIDPKPSLKAQERRKKALAPFKRRAANNKAPACCRLPSREGLVPLRGYPLAVADKTL